MQNTASSSRPLTSRMPGQLHTPTHSFSEAAFTPDSTSEGKTIAWNDKRSKDDLDMMRSRLSDQKFNMKDYEDPLLPRQFPPSHYYPQGVTAEIETHLLGIIAQIKGSSA